MSRHPRLPLTVVGAALFVAACTTGSPLPSAGASGDPGTNGSPQGSGGGLEHPTGARDIVLRYDEGGGFMVPEFLVTMAPIFTLYGDGTVVFRDPTEAPPPTEDGLIRNPAFQTAKLSEEQVQALLSFAANEGALGIARDRYDHGGVADAGTAVFTINAGGRQKQVSVYALGIEGAATPDDPIRRQFQRLAERLRNFDQDGQIPTVAYEPPAWRGVLIESPGVAAPTREWPWPDIAPTDFKAPAAGEGFAFPTRVMTLAELEPLDLGDISGGAQGIYLAGPDGKTYALALRPLLPDEDR